MDLKLTSMIQEKKPWIIGCTMSLLIAALSLWDLKRRIDMGTSRLYWEYAGRILHMPVTKGYVEWVQHRTGTVADLATAAALPARLAPYTGFPSEYPPGALLFFASIRFFFESLRAFDLAFGLIVGTLFLMTLAISLWVLKTLQSVRENTSIWLFLALLFAALSPALMGRFSLARFDMLPAFLAIAGVAIFMTQRPILAAFVLGLGASVKLWPGIFIALIAVAYWTSSGNRLKPAWIVISGVLAFALPHLVMICLGTDIFDSLNYLNFLRFRPLQVESLPANILVLYSHIVGQKITTGFDFGSQNVYGSGSRVLILACSLANAAGLAFTIWTLFKSRLSGAKSLLRSEIVLLACGFSVTLTILCSRVSSGEYLMWVIPFIFALFLEKRDIIGVICFTAALVFLRLTYTHYSQLVNGGLSGTIFCFTKNLLMVVVACIFAIRLSISANRLARAARLE